MLTTVHHVLSAVAVLATAVIYGTDVFCAVVQRSAMAGVDDEIMISVMGLVHLYGDRRLPLPGGVGLVATLLTTVVAVLGGAPLAVATGAAALVCLLGWLIIYTRVSAPINRALTKASQAGETLDNARELQNSWDSVINLRAGFQGLALVALFVGAVWA